MELSIEQALQYGASAHKEGKLEEAERFYRAILKFQPAHPDANHNLGVIAVSANKADAALPLFKTALEANPQIEQFWLSYIDALIRDKQFDNAKQVLEQAKKQGVDLNRLNLLEVKLSPKNQKTKTARVSPPQAQLNSLLEHYQNERFSDAENLAKTITQEFPNDNFSWKVLAAVFKSTDRKSEAVFAGKKAVEITPDDAKAHNNLGVTFNELGRLDDSEASYKQAIAFKPDYPEAHNNLGNTLNELDRLDEAVESYAQAIALKPDFTDAYINLSIVVKKARFNSSNRKLYQSLVQLLTNGNFTRPNDVAPSILSLLKHDPLIKNLLAKNNFTMSFKDATSIIGRLDKLALLHHLMRVCPLPELQFEGLFVAIRSFLLKNLNKIEVTAELIYFLSTLSLHCFVNEYIYAESDEEICLVEELEDEIMQTLAQSEQPEVIKILCLASYRPLHQYDWCQNLESLDNLEELKKRLIEEPLLEKMIARDIPVLGEISNDVSLKVREQYEENPYPRWVKLRVPIKAKPIAAVCDELKLQLHSENIKKVTAPFILIAGCGTGQHSIGTTSRFSNCQVTAVDLSLASLAYAKRKSNELRLTNIEYLQADILHLHQMGKEFDIIESGGVLHHMDEPMAGWKVLTDLLKPGGLMKIGLYSELARSQIIKAQREIVSLGIGVSATEIRSFRESLRLSESEGTKRLKIISDFYSLSEFRDLVFHVQEHRFTFLQIKNCLYELGLKFCGFENTELVSSFREFHGEEVDICDLMLWHEFEEIHPDTFIEMYQFWCQKL